MFRAFPRTWKEETTGPPRHYSWEEGYLRSAAHLACGHVGRHWSCHVDGHPCSCMSTSILASEALGRLEEDMTLNIIFVPTRCWEHVATDLSSPEAVRRIPNIDHYCESFSIRQKDVTKWSYFSREVVLDKRQLLATPPPDLYVLEVPFHNPVVQGARAYCNAAHEVMHQVSCEWIQAEAKARADLVKLATPSLESWLLRKLPVPPPPVRPPPEADLDGDNEFSSRWKSEEVEC